MSDWDAKVQIQPLDLFVYGQVQYEFSVYDALAGKYLDGKSLGDAAVSSTTRRAVVVEEAITAIARSVERRSTAVQELGFAMSHIAYVVAMFSGDTSENNINHKISDCDGASDSEKADMKARMKKALDILEKYGVDIDNKGTKYSADTVTKGDVSAIQSGCKLALDKENNALQQTQSDLRSLLSKRDSAYSMIGKLQKKVDGTARRTIGQIGQ
ncbi:MAG: hypothetical protein MJ138_01485 [Kiritimatiellae bacterium]|nr:hypothetical protein [Kiritimatiellia bacterium]